MTLERFRIETAAMCGTTKLRVLDPWGELNPLAILTPEDLVEGDPLIDELHPDEIVICSEAD